MPDRLLITLLLVATSPSVLAQVDETSSAYQMGQYVGYAFVAVLLLLIVRKIIKK